MASVAKRAPELFNFVYGLFNWCVFALISIWSGAFFQKPSEKDKNNLAIGMLAPPHLAYRTVPSKAYAD